MPRTLESVLRRLQESEIVAGAEFQTDGRLRLWIGPPGDIKAETTIGGSGLEGRALSDAGALWLHQAAVRFYPASRYAKSRSR